MVIKNFNRTMCKSVFHSLLNFTHITQDFCLSQFPMLWVIGQKSLVQRTVTGRRPQIWPTQKFWRGAPYGIKTLFEQLMSMFTWVTVCVKCIQSCWIIGRPIFKLKLNVVNQSINQSINIRLIKAWQNAGLYNWVIRHTNKNVISKNVIGLYQDTV